MGITSFSSSSSLVFSHQGFSSISAAFFAVEKSIFVSSFTFVMVDGHDMCQMLSLYHDEGFEVRGKDGNVINQCVVHRNRNQLNFRKTKEMFCVNGKITFAASDHQGNSSSWETIFQMITEEE